MIIPKLAIHIHTPKTAGRTIARATISHLKKEYGADDIQVNFFNNNLEGWKSRLLMLIRPVISGHVSISELNRLGINTSSAFTVQREPINRCLSYYYMVNRGMSLFGKELSIEDFFKNDHPKITKICHNLATYQLGDFIETKDRNPDGALVLSRAKRVLREMSFFLVFEHLQEDVERFGAGIISPNLSTTTKSNHKDRVYHDELTEEQMSIISSINRLDVELYDYALELRQKRTEQSIKSFQPD